MSSAGVKMGLEWKAKTPFEEARVQASLVALGGLLYYIGGWNLPSGCTNTVVCYDPELDEWNFCAGLSKARCHSGCVATEKHILIIGGGTTFRPQRASVLSSVEKYDPERNSWSCVSPLNEARSHPNCVYWSGKIYAIGGINNSPFRTSNCEVYSPNTDEWVAIAQLPYPHCGFNNAIIVENQITVPVLFNMTDYSCDALKYCVRSNKWQKIMKLGPSDRIATFSLCTMKLPVLILERMQKVLCPEDFFGDWKNNTQENGYSAENESESSSDMIELVESEDSDDI